MSTKIIYNLIIVLSTPLEIFYRFLLPSAKFKGSHKKSYCKVLIILFLTGSIIGLIIPISSFAQVENKSLEVPGTFEEAKNFLFSIIKPLPDAMKGVWREALVVWQKMTDFLKGLFDSKVKPWFQNIWQEILGFFGRELEKKELMIQEEIEKEKEEIKKEIPKIGKSIWEKIKGLIGR